MLPNPTLTYFCVNKTTNHKLMNLSGLGLILNRLVSDLILNNTKKKVFLFFVLAVGAIYSLARRSLPWFLTG